MSKKDVGFVPKPTARQVDPEDAGDKWVKDRTLPVAKQPIVRMTFDLSKELHVRFRTTCSQLDRNMTDELRDFVERFLEENERKS